MLEGAFSLPPPNLYRSPLILDLIGQIYFAALLYSYAHHLRKGSYRSLPLTDALPPPTSNPNPSQSSRVNGHGPFGSLSTSALAPASADEYELGPGDEESGLGLGAGPYNVAASRFPPRPSSSTRDSYKRGPSKLSVGGSTTAASLAAGAHAKHAEIVQGLEAPLESVLWDEDDEDASAAEGSKMTTTSESDADGDIGKGSRRV